MKEQPGNDNDFEPSTTIAGKQETTKRQLSPPDQVFVNVSDSPYQLKNFKFPAKSFRSKNPTKRTRTKGIVDKCSDLTCTKKYALTEGPKQGWS